MLQVLIHIIIISCICMLWGLLYFAFSKSGGLPVRRFRHFTELFVFLFFSGLIIISVIGSWLVLLLPLKFSYLLFLILLPLLFIIIKRKKYLSGIRSLFKESQPVFSGSAVILSVAGILMFVVLGFAKTVNIDTEIYHLQIIRWTNEYGTVPGLANLYPRFGLSSSWFNLISFFHVPAFNAQNFTYLNATTVIWFFIWLVYKTEWNRKSKDGNSSLSLFYFLLLVYSLFDWQLLRNTANSTSHDFIVTALLIFCIAFIIDDIFNSRSLLLPVPVLIVLALSVIPFKLSGILVLLLLLYFLLLQNKKKNYLTVFAAGIIIILPHFIRNYFISGYPLYPIAFSPLQPDWQLPADMVKYFNEYILYNNRYYNQTIDFVSTAPRSIQSWIPYWFSGILLQHKIIIAAAITSAVVFVFKKEPEADRKKIRRLMAVLLLMLTGWFISAPDPRFGFGFILPLAFLPVSLYAGKFIHQKFYPLLLLIIAGAVCFYTYKKSDFVTKEPAYLLRPVSADQPPFRNVTKNGIELNTTEKINNNWNNRCFFTPLPCLCEENPFIKPRGENLKDGFRMDPEPDSHFIRKYNY